MFHTSRKALAIGLASTFAVGALGGPAAIAQPIDAHGAGYPAIARQDARSPDARDFAQGRKIVASTPVRIAAPERSARAGFEWGDAAIGAGGALSVVLLGAGGTYALVRRRQRAAAPSHQTTLAA